MKLNKKQRETIASLIGEGVHTFLRKYCDSARAHDAWTAIADMPDEEWNVIVESAAAVVAKYIDSEEDVSRPKYVKRIFARKRAAAAREYSYNTTNRRMYRDGYTDGWEDCEAVLTGADHAPAP